MTRRQVPFGSVLLKTPSSEPVGGVGTGAGGVVQELKVKTGDSRQKEKKMFELELRDMVLNMVEQKVSSMLYKNKKYYQLIDELISKKTDPYQAAEELGSVILR